MKKKSKKMLIRILISLLTLIILLLLIAKFFVPLSGWVITQKHKISGYSSTEVLLAGSSTMFMWKSYKDDLPGYDCENVGVSGSNIADWNGWLDDLVFPFEPQKILLYAGANDIHNDGGSGEKAGNDFIALCEKIHEKLPGAKIYAISVYTIGSHPEYMPEDIIFNEVLKTGAESRGYMEYIDVWTPLLDENGNVRNEVFAKDLLHLSKDGYVIWTNAIREVLDKE